MTMKPCRRQPQDSSPCLRASARSVLTGRRPDVRRMGGEKGGGVVWYGRNWRAAEDVRPYQATTLLRRRAAEDVRPLPGHNASATAGGRGRPPLPGHDASATAGDRGRPPLPEKNASVCSVVKKKRADATERVPPVGKKRPPGGEAFDRMGAERVNRSSARIPS